MKTMNSFGLLIAGIILFANMQNVHAQIKPQQYIATTPPMGWNSWNYFGSSVSEETIKKTADLMVEKGLVNAGYKYLVIDDTWMYGRVKRVFDINAPKDRWGRDANGRLMVDTQKFPSGMKSLADYVHAKGLKFGIYTSPGCATCGGYTASLGYESTDLKTFAEWGVDFIKLDNCGASEAPEVILNRWRTKIDSIGRPMVLSINISQKFDTTSKYADMWRTTTDMMPVWRYKNEMLRVGYGDDVFSVINQQVGLDKFQGNGHWNDPDMLQVGNGAISTTDNKDFDALGEQTRLVKGNMTYDENKAHFGMWAMFGAPLILGNDLANMKDSIRDLLVNPEVIAINQDPAGIMGVKLKEDTPGIQIWAKRLWKIGDVAVAFLNATDKETEISLKLSDLGISGQAFFRDAFLRKDLGLFADKFSVKLQKNSILLAKVSAFETIKPLNSCFKPLDAAESIILLEAEDTRFYCGKSQNKLDGFSGKGYAIGENHTFSKFRIVWSFDLERKNDYKLTIKYKNYSKVDLNYKINGIPVQFKAPTAKDAKWSEVSIVLPLNNGRQKIDFVAPNSSSNQVAIDCIELSKIIK